MRMTSEKLDRIRAYLDAKGFDGMVLARQDNFSWISSGGNNRVVEPKNIGHAAITVTRDKVYLVGQYMDCMRIADEEMSLLEAEPVVLMWYEQSVLDKARELAGKRVVCDEPIAGAQCRLDDIYALHTPLFQEELVSLRHAGAVSDMVLYRVARQITPGMTDYEAEALLRYEYAKENVQCDVVLVGTDERMFKYRHPNPVGRALGRYVMLHGAVRYRGLHSNVSRSVYFGDAVPEEIARPYDVSCRIEAYCMSRCVPGTLWKDIVAGQRAIYEATGYPEDWKYHYPGGRTGYYVSQSELSLDPSKAIENREAYDFYITATGAKVEELSVNWDGKFEILSNTGLWPSAAYETGECRFMLPQIMLR